MVNSVSDFCKLVDWIASICVSCLVLLNLFSRGTLNLIKGCGSHAAELWFAQDWLSCFRFVFVCFKWFRLLMLFQIVSDHVSLLRNCCWLFFHCSSL